MEKEPDIPFAKSVATSTASQPDVNCSPELNRQSASHNR